MPNIVSSAITNAPPPNAVANMLNKRNKIHHLDANTDEDLMRLFWENPDGKVNTVNQTTLPARNYCLIVESDGSAIESNGHAVGASNNDAPENTKTHNRTPSKSNPKSAPSMARTSHVAGKTARARKD